jgi:hypothetical protein
MKYNLMPCWEGDMKVCPTQKYALVELAESIELRIAMFLPCSDL